MPRMTEDDLKALLSAEKADALSAMEAAKLSQERERAMDYYNGDVSDDMPTVTDRSKAVSYDVSDTVEGLMPSLMEIFCGGDEVVKFSPVGPEDEDAAEQETAYVNHVFMEKNPGFLITYSFIKDALISKNGIVKIHWHETEEEERETFYDQPDDVYALIAADPEIEIVEHTEHPPEAPPPAMMPDMGTAPNVAPGGMNPMPGPDAQAQPMMPSPAGAAAMPPSQPDAGEVPSYGPTHDFTIVRKRKYGCCKVDPVPPEEFGVGRTAKLGEPLSYSFHAVQKSQADLIKAGYDEDQIKELPSAQFDSSSEATSRDTVDDRQMASLDDINRANRLIDITEHYCMLDYEDDGKTRLYRVTTGGDQELQVLRRNGKADIEQIEFDPFATITPFIVTHRYFGRSVADLVIDIQRIKTSLTRGALDNVYLANNQRLEVAEANAHEKTLEDILDNRIGGVVRTRVPGGIMPIPNQPIGDFIFPMVEYYDQVREWRTGVTRQGQGLDPDALQNIGENAVIRAQNAAMEKTKLIARIFAETGFKDLFWKMHATIRKNESSRPTEKLRDKWVTVDPREWKKRTNLKATVGLGGGSKSEQIAFWGNVISSQKESLQAVPGLTTPGQIYNSMKKYMELGGERAVDRYWSNPDEQPPQDTPPDPKMIEAQGKLQIADQKAQADQAMQAQKLAADKERMTAEMMLKRQQIEAEFALKREQLAAETDLRRQQLEWEMNLAEQEAAAKAIVGVHAANVKAASQPVRLGGKPG